ncbi:MAG: methylamine dehydrogenase light chain, partial [Gammaproteobacteria bacterium]
MNIEKIIERGYYWIDDQARSSSLALARRISRRSFLSKLGMMLAGAAAFPLLPVARSFAQSSVEEVGDPQSCEYWRYCAMSGTLCSCCGGTYTSCPPGSEASPITWVGTCR